MDSVGTQEVLSVEMKPYQIKTIDTTVYTQLSHQACFTCEVNGFVQIPAVHSRAGPTTAFGQIVG